MKGNSLFSVTPRNFGGLWVAHSPHRMLWRRKSLPTHHRKGPFSWRCSGLSLMNDIGFVLVEVAGNTAGIGYDGRANIVHMLRRSLHGYV